MKKYIDILVALIVAVPFIAVLYLTNPSITIGSDYINAFSVKIPAVVGDKGILTTYYMKVLDGSGRVFSSIPPVYEKNFAIGYLFSKEAACKLYNNCNNYDYLFYTDDVVFAEGFSGTAGFYILIAKFFENKSIANYPITGYMLPNGLIASVGGLYKKLDASLENGYNYLVAPVSGKENIIPAFTMLDLERIYFNKTFNTSIKVPENYYSVIRNITFDICKNVSYSEIKEYIKNNRYYTAASLCFGKIVKSNITFNEAEINKEINGFYKKINSTKCDEYVCKEILYQVRSRLDVAKSSNGTLKYARYLTAKGWMEFLSLNYTRVDTCKEVKEEYKIVSYFYNLPKTNDCFEMRENLAKLYYNLIEYRSEDALYSIINLTKFYLNKNGFSISSYNYMIYSEDLFRGGDADSAFYYAILALEYAV